jgi:hypothetical protein
MRVLKLILLLSIIQVLGGQLLFPSGNAYAKPCCPDCNSCAWFFTKCWCPGLNGCAWFYCAPHHPDDSSTLQARTLTNNERLDITGSYSSVPSSTPRPDNIDRLITLPSSGQCARYNLTMKFFQSAEDRLKFEPDFLKYNSSQDNNIVAFQIPMNEEK